MSALPENQADGAERRVAPRLRTLKRAKVIFNNRFSSFDCIVRNISATGALLTIDAAAHLPKTFEIRIGEEAERDARLVYRRGMLAGIRFLDADAQESESRVEAAAAAAPSKAPAAAPERAPRVLENDVPQAILRNFSWSLKRD